MVIIHARAEARAVLVAVLVGTTFTARIPFRGIRSSGSLLAVISRHGEDFLTYVPAQLVAQRLGVKTQTLGKWRRCGRGPKGWIYVSTTLVCYPADAVDRFLDERSRAQPAFRNPPSQ